LIGEGRGRRALDHDESAVCGLVTTITRLGELIERADKLGAVARLDRLFNLLNRGHDGGFDHLADWHVLVDGKFRPNWKVARNRPCGAAPQIREAL
jgi:hypothetical protein